MRLLYTGAISSDRANRLFPHSKPKMQKGAGFLAPNGFAV